MDNKLNLVYIVDRYNGKPVDFMFVTKGGDYYIAHGDRRFTFLGRTFSEFIPVQKPNREDYPESFYAEEALRNAISTNDSEKIEVQISSEEFCTRFFGDRNNIKFTL